MTTPFRLAPIAALLLIAGLAGPAPTQERFAPLPGEPAAAADRADAPGGDPRLRSCVVGLVHKIELPASEAGILVYLGVKEGAEIQSEQVIAQIDDREARQALSIAEYGFQAAEARAEDTVDIEYSQAAALVARAGWMKMKQVNKQEPGAIPEIEVLEKRLEYDRGLLGEKKAVKDKHLAGLDANVKLAELEAAKLGIEKRKVLAPFDGEVLEVVRHQQEWVQPGDTIVVVARLDTLQVDGYVDYEHYDPSEVDGCEVTIDVMVGRGRVVQATGRVVYVDPIAVYESSNQFRVRAEIANRRENGRWLISPNLTADMTIHLGAGGDTGVGARPAPNASTK